MTRRFVVSIGGSVSGVEAADLPEPDTTPLLGSLRLDVVPLDPRFAAGAGFELLVYVNDVEMTRIGAGIGMDPRDLFIPENQLVAIAKPHTIPIARCDCGHHGCAGTDVTIIRRGDVVVWDWLGVTPIDRSVVFNGVEYDRETARIAGEAIGLADSG